MVLAGYFQVFIGINDDGELGMVVDGWIMLMRRIQCFNGKFPGEQTLCFPCVAGKLSVELIPEIAR